MPTSSLPVPPGWIITCEQADLFALEQYTPDVRDHDGDVAFYISGKVTGDGQLTFGLRTRWNGQLATVRGEQLFRLMMIHFNTQGTTIQLLQAHWMIGDLEDNLRSFNQAVLQNLTQEEAALKHTFTGKMAERILQSKR